MIKTIFALAYLFFGVCFFAWFLLFAMIINLLVWADVETPEGTQGGGVLLCRVVPMVWVMTHSWALLKNS